MASCPRTTAWPPRGDGSKVWRLAAALPARSWPHLCTYHPIDAWEPIRRAWMPRRGEQGVEVLRAGTLLSDSDALSGVAGSLPSGRMVPGSLTGVLVLVVCRCCHHLAFQQQGRV